MRPCHHGARTGPVATARPDGARLGTGWRCGHRSGDCAARAELGPRRAARGPEWPVASHAVGCLGRAERGGTLAGTNPGPGPRQGQPSRADAGGGEVVHWQSAQCVYRIRSRWRSLTWRRLRLPGKPPESQSLWRCAPASGSDRPKNTGIMRVKSHPNWCSGFARLPCIVNATAFQMQW